jgi:hypothetical protein
LQCIPDWNAREIPHTRVVWIVDPTRELTALSSSVAMVEIAENNENGSLLLGLVFAVVGQEDKDVDERFREWLLSGMWAGSESSESSRGSTD